MNSLIHFMPWIIRNAALLLAVAYAFTARADEKASKGEENSAIDKQTMRVRVVDQAGKPIAGATVFASYWSKPELKADERTDRFGFVTLDCSADIKILRLWVSHPNYITLFRGWEEGEHNNGRSLPREYTFRLPQGGEIGGRIVDEAGQPVRDVKVSVQIRADKLVADSLDPAIKYSGSLATDEDALRTDADGRWSCPNVPIVRDDLPNPFTIELEHPEYIHDGRSLNSHRKQKVSIKSLYARTAQVSMSRGIRVFGTVTDPEGKPIPDALVIGGTDPYFHHDEPEVKTDVNGRYEFPAIQSGELPITVIARKWRPELKKLGVTIQSRQMDFQLQPGCVTRVRFVDSSGNVVKNATVSVRGWRGMKSLHNQWHSNVLPTGIPRRANEKGIWAWNWSPEDAVMYEAWSDGFAEQEIELSGSNELQTIVLYRPLKPEGTVVDAVTKKPISEFDAIPGLKFDHQWTPILKREKRVRGTDGKFELAGVAQENDLCQIRIEAEGYRVAVGKIFDDKRDEHHETFELEPAPTLHGRVFNVEHQPLSDVSLIVASETEFQQLDSFEEYLKGTLRTDSDGRFNLPAQVGDFVLLLSHDRGFAQRKLGRDEPIGEIALKPWSTIDATVLQDGRLVAESYVRVSALDIEPSFDHFLHHRFGIKTNDEGKAVFARVPPVPITIDPDLSVWGEYPITSSRSLAIEPKPDEQLKLSFGGNGAKIVGKIRMSNVRDEKVDLNYSLNWLIRRGSMLKSPEIAAPELDVFKSKGWSQAFLDSVEGRRLASLHEKHFVRLKDDGSFLIGGVQPGDYDFVLNLYEKPEGCLVEPIAFHRLEVIVSGKDAANERMDLGEIEVPIENRLRVGDLLPVISIVDSDGAKSTIEWQAGQHSIVYGWASWCRPCMAALPQMVAFHEASSIEGIRLIGLNMDQDIEAAHAIVAAKKLSWKHHFVGRQSETTKELRMSSIPTYLLFDGSGRLVARTQSFDEVSKAAASIVPGDH